MKDKKYQIISIYLAIISISLFLLNDLFKKYNIDILLVGFILLLAPFLLISISYLIPSFAKSLRIVFFKYFRIVAITQISLVILVICSLTSFYNYITFSYNVKQIYLNIFFINFILIFSIILVLAKRIQIKEPNALLIQQQGEPEVYLYRDGFLHHIPDPPTLDFLGYSVLDIQVIKKTEFEKYNKKGPLESVLNARVLQSTERPEVYMIIGEEKHHIPNPNTLLFIQQLRNQNQQTLEIEMIDQSKLDSWPTGKPLMSVI